MNTKLLTILTMYLRNGLPIGGILVAEWRASKMENMIEPLTQNEIEGADDVAAASEKDPHGLDQHQAGAIRVGCKTCTKPLPGASWQRGSMPPLAGGWI